jgi:hypothetical protein
MPSLPRPGDKRLREFREAGITAPIRRFVFQVVEARPWRLQRTWVDYAGVWRALSTVRVAVREDPERPGGLLVELAGPATVKLDGRWLAVGGKPLAAREMEAAE